ncbi:MAG: hypothetical protein ACPL4K_04220, partial [Candidatus Margulisiibacteriota bacterium]
GIPEATERNGAWLINLSLTGKLPTTGSLWQQTHRVGVNALDHIGLKSVIAAFAEGDYWIRGGVSFKRSDEEVVLKYVLSYSQSGLSQDEIELVRKILRPEEMFTKKETQTIGELVKKLEGLNISFLSETDRIIYRQAVADIESAVTRLERKGGLSSDEVATLSRLSHYLETYGIMITDGQFIHEEPTPEMINKVPFGITNADGTVDSREDFIKTYGQ